uniref:BZIP domain-containing protein n=1 Tax=Rhodosorus marinus TaxID=101924 RepID=A0A7S3EB31_9RHOD|mmetsp:Transcript_22716/g.90989  ORF Transcript_22716/g.90989 Transcript_22716/m.90989 type:complete len:308 (+) Transcript_22716:442-1365(+)
MMFEDRSKQGELEMDLKEMSDMFPSLEPIEESSYMPVEDSELLFPDELFKVTFEENNPYSLPSSTTAASSEPRPAVKPANLKVSKAVESTPVVENMTATEHSWDDSGDEAPQPLPEGSSSGRCAIESAKKKAQQAATESSQQRDRKRAAEEAANEEQSSDGKRQKTESSKHEERLKKNRKTAYISRIRRRVYTKELEAALMKSENVKEEVQKQNGDLQSELAKLRAEVAELREQVSVSGGSPAPSTLPSESEPEEIHKGTGLDIGPVFLSEVFQVNDDGKNSTSVVCFAGLQIGSSSSPTLIDSFRV